MVRRAKMADAKTDKATKVSKDSDKENQLQTPASVNNEPAVNKEQSDGSGGSDPPRLPGILGARSFNSAPARIQRPNFPGIQAGLGNQHTLSINQVSPLMTPDDYWQSLPSYLRLDSEEPDDIWADSASGEQLQSDSFDFDGSGMCSEGMVSFPSSTTTTFPGLDSVLSHVATHAMSDAEDDFPTQNVDTGANHTQSAPGPETDGNKPKGGDQVQSGPQIDLLAAFQAQTERRQVEDAGPELPEQLAVLANQTWTRSGSTDFRALYGKYPRPKNTVVHKVELNTPIFTILPVKVRSRDLKVKAVQATLATGGCAILQAFRLANDAMIAGGSLDPDAFEPVLEALVDSLTFLAHGNELINTLRRDMMRWTFAPKYREVTRSTPEMSTSSLLFGEDLPEKFRHLDQASRIAGNRSFSSYNSSGRGRQGYRGRGRYRYNPAGRQNQNQNQNFLGKRDYCTVDTEVQSLMIQNTQWLSGLAWLHSQYQSSVDEYDMGDNCDMPSAFRQEPAVATAAATSELVGFPPRQERGQQCQSEQTIDTSSQEPPLVGEFLPIDISRWAAYKAGRMRNCCKIWESWTSDSAILNAVRGYKIPFDDWPIQTHIPYNPHFSPEEEEFLHRKMLEFQESGVVERCEHTHGEFISMIFLRPKKTPGEFRLILNLKGLNTDVEYRHFKMDTLITALRLITPGCSMATLDIRDAYFSVSIHPEFRKFLRFYYRNELFQFTCLPQGLACAPRLFTKLLKVPMAQLHEHHNVTASAYIDDILVVDDSPQLCYEATCKTAELLQDGGLTISPKSQMLPSTVKEYIGFVIDSETMQVRLPVEKTEKIRHLVEQIMAKDEVTLREVAQLLGKLEATKYGNKYASLFTRRLTMFKNQELLKAHYNYEATVTLTTAVIQDLDWWVEHLADVEAPIFVGDPDHVIYTDASNDGWGVFVPDEDIRFGGRWTEVESESHINVLELTAILFALKAQFRFITDSHIRVYTDNMTAKLCIENQGSVRSEQCNEVTRDIWNWAMERNNWITMAHVPGVLNVAADEESRQFHEDNEWKLKPRLFKDICNRFGMPDIDLFASRLNYQLKPFCSWLPDPEAEVIDSFSISWQDTFGYAFPPFALIPRVLQKIRLEKAEIILIVPKWQTQPWFNLLRKLLVTEPFEIILFPDVLSLHSSSRVHPLAQSGKTRLLACRLSGRNIHSKATVKQS